MSRPRRPLTNDQIALPPAVFVGGKDQLFVKHDPHHRYKRSYGVVMMSPAGFDILRSHMAPRDNAVLMALISALQWFKIDYEAQRIGNRWHLNCTEDGAHVLATMEESGIVTIGISIADIVDRITERQRTLIDKLAEATLAVTGKPIDPERAWFLLNASTKQSYSANQVGRSIRNLKRLGLIIGHEHAGPDKWYFILNPFFYCNGPTFMRDALIKHLSASPTGNIVSYSEDISQARPPRRRQTNAELQRDNAELRRRLKMAHGFVAKIAETQALPAELLQQAHIVLRGDSEHG